MKASSFFTQVLHQFRSEWRHLWTVVVLWIALLLLGRWSVTGGFGVWIVVVQMLAAAAVVWSSVSSDLPSSSDSFTLSRPIRQSALWCGKMLFLASAVVLPVLLNTGVGWRGFELGPAQWLAMGGSVVLVAGLLCAFVGCLTALASTPRQVIALALVAVVGSVVWVVIQPWISREEEMTLESIQRDYCGSLVGGIIAFFGLLIGWYLATVPRRRIIAGIVVAVALLVSNWVAQTWDQNWVSMPGLKYARAETVELKTGPFDPKAERPGRRLWPTLRIAGLGKDEVATVLEFAPVREGEEWPPEGSHTDIPTTERGSSSWLNHEHIRALFKHYPQTTLWQSRVGNNVMYNGRPSLEQTLTAMQLRREDAVKETWRLRIVVHEMVRIEAMPWRKLWTQNNQIVVRPGVRLDLEAFSRQHDAWESHGILRRLSSAVLTLEKHANPYIRGRFVDDDFFLVLADREMGENRVYGPNLYERQLSGRSWIRPTQQWIASEGQRFEYRLWQPAEQRAFLSRNVDDWIDDHDAHFWYAAEKGVVEFELGPEQMVEVLPKPEPKKE